MISFLFVVDCVQVAAVKTVDGSNSRISPYTKSYLQGTDDDISGTHSVVAEQHQQPESDAKKPPPASSTSVVAPQTGMSANSPYVPIPSAGSDLPISPYSCIEQTADNCPVSADADVRPRDAVIEVTEGTKCDGYIPWASTQPSL